MKKTPKILIVTDMRLIKKAMGAPRTLINIVSHYPQDQILLFSPNVNKNDASTFFKTILHYKTKLITVPRIIDLIFSKLILKINRLFFLKSKIHCVDEINEFDPDLILLSPNGSLGLVMGYKLMKLFPNKRFITYIMDDWLYKNEEIWGGISIQKIAKEILNNSDWMMISDQLLKEMNTRYGNPRNDSIVIHNPVENKLKERPRKLNTNKKVISLAYAGSIWNMHSDALMLLVESISKLSEKGYDVKFYIYSKLFHWNNFECSSGNVIYGGEIEYENLQQTLSNHDFLICSASFEEHLWHIVKSSVQTKLTDYMVAQKPIISIGPLGSACNDFVEKWNVGYAINTNNVEMICESLEHIFNDYTNFDEIVGNQSNVIEQHFSKDVINIKFDKFINSCLC